MDLFSKFKDNIIFLPTKSQFKIKYLSYGSVFLKVSYNISDNFIYNSYSKEFVYSEISNSERIIGNITIIFDDNLYACRYDKSTYVEGEVLTKSHPMYMENVSNVFFETDNEFIHIFHYPNEYITIMKKDKNEFLAIVSNEQDAIAQLLFAIKKLISRYNYYNNIFSLHCAAVKKNGQTLLFLGGSYSGQTTLFLNLICNGYEPINDDVVYWKFENGKILVSGIPSCFNIRKHPDNLIMSDGYWIHHDNLEFNNVYSDNVFEYSEVHTIYVPEFGYDKTEIVEKLKVDRKRILRACAIHSDVFPTNDFLIAFNGLLSCKFKKINMSSDYNEVMQCIIG